MNKKMWIGIALFGICSICSYLFLFNSKMNLEIPKETQEKVKQSGSLDVYLINFYKEKDIKYALPTIKKYVHSISGIGGITVNIVTSEKYKEVLKEELGGKIHSIDKPVWMPEG